MILERLTFEYQNKILIEKMKIRTPFKYEAQFQNKGCFIYFKEKGPKMYSSQEMAQLNKQEAVLLKCGNHFLELLREVDDEQIEVIVVHLFPEILKRLYTKELSDLIKKNTDTKQSQVIASNEIITRFIDSLEFYFQNPALVNNDLLELKIKELVLLLIQSKNVRSVLELINDLYSSKSIEIREVIKLHTFSNLNLEELAKLCQLSLSSFKREFKKEFNDSPANYITLKKIEKGKELLKITNLTVSEIAYEIGFNDPHYFTRTFKKKAGISPSGFRKNTSDPIVHT